jgi:hypothetical protein
MHGKPFFMALAFFIRAGGFPKPRSAVTFTNFLLGESKSYARTQPALQPDQGFAGPAFWP